MTRRSRGHLCLFRVCHHEAIGRGECDALMWVTDDMLVRKSILFNDEEDEAAIEMDYALKPVYLAETPPISI